METDPAWAASISEILRANHGLLLHIIELLTPASTGEPTQTDLLLAAILDRLTAIEATLQARLPPLKC